MFRGFKYGNHLEQAWHRIHTEYVSALTLMVLICAHGPQTSRTEAPYSPDRWPSEG